MLGSTRASTADRTRATAAEVVSLGGTFMTVLTMLLFFTGASPKPMTPPPPLAFVRGVAVADAPALKAWLTQQTATVRLPVALELAPVHAVKNARVGTLALKLDDSALGVSLADRAHQFCPRDGRPCVLWLEGRWKDGAFKVTRVQGPATDGEFAEVEAPAK